MGFNSAFKGLNPVYTLQPDVFVFVFSHPCLGLRVSVHFRVSYKTPVCVIVLTLFATKHSLTHCGRVTQICVFNTVKLGTSASSP